MESVAITALSIQPRAAAEILVNLDYLQKAIDKLDTKRFQIKNWSITTAGALLAVAFGGRLPVIAVVGVTTHRLGPGATILRRSEPASTAREPSVPWTECARGPMRSQRGERSIGSWTRPDEVGQPPGGTGESRVRRPAAIARRRYRRRRGERRNRLAAGDRRPGWHRLRDRGRPPAD